MIQVNYKPSFIRQFDALEPELQDEALEKIELLKNPKNHLKLRVYKLHGALKNCFSFSVNYKVRIVFENSSKTEIVLLVIGNHDMYR
ncbi:MAG: hypothetical protein A2836_01780 [Candidatus Taylorbacteria bacterium RIFCSPHIGHO2_01_FULL_45_63]|uniref:Plasmid stabilization protein n=1 Tax=Candidatus Taylorbacteria bacterium RIFCSPHIGHO2_02_FULL_45_35 TaxID=1802311 RepID=A0A1G2MTH9_9BACT|nr:MAG: hypothetical protein A2836_01780 [Candidatus Taylorbacteria bacterium RIFCSPHIGHO2_01_FULL_45_63]OHA26352.1 MAG: hypothetical protein A3D56_03685 [Candidatus Taylorbacteria bacterium RIFCSPHIGHO2_02_FULL_45_35]OHA32796.1 MAG: hypothetical protein A3A22_02540 [Candidatus Taylorbacteria bacterium RIFCSPLOWO2_01_FULL_45_34b]